MVSPKGLVSAGVGIVGMVIPMLYPEIEPWIGWSIIGLASVVILYGLYQIFGLDWLPQRKMPISAAAKLMYNKCGPSLRAFAVNQSNREPFETPSKYFEGALITAAREELISLFGSREPGLRSERIPPDYLDGVYQATDGHFASYFNDAHIEWFDIWLTKKDAIKAMKEFELDEIKQRLTNN